MDLIIYYVKGKKTQNKTNKWWKQALDTENNSMDVRREVGSVYVKQVKGAENN